MIFSNASPTPFLSFHVKSGDRCDRKDKGKKCALLEKQNLYAPWQKTKLKSELIGQAAGARL